MADVEDLITSFRQGHQTIVDTIEQIQYVSHGNYAQVKPKLRELDKVLQLHFGRENREFMDNLGDFYEKNREATKMIEFLHHDLTEVKVTFLTFIEKYSGDLSDKGSGTFPKDFYDFSIELLQRIKTEEEYLIPLIKGMGAVNN